MDNIFINLSLIGLGNLSAAQLASVLDEEKICPGGWRALRAQAPPSTMKQGMKVERDKGPFIRADFRHGDRCLTKYDCSR